MLVGAGGGNWGPCRWLWESLGHTGRRFLSGTWGKKHIGKGSVSWPTIIRLRVALHRSLASCEGVHTPSAF